MGPESVLGMVERILLVVDDEPLIRMLLTSLFEDQGYIVFEAECADAAIATLERHPAIRVVVTDVQMPGSIDGLRLAHFIRDRWPPTGLIVASGAAELSSAELPCETTFLRKPFDFGVLSAEIVKLSRAE